jgi:hypothetical protein
LEIGFLDCGVKETPVKKKKKVEVNKNSISALLKKL